MYLRHTIRKKDGKVHRYWRLVRSVRIGGRVVQQTVAHLGELDEHGRIEARALARQLIGAPEQAGLFDDGTQQATVPVRLKGIRLERSRRFGDVYLALALWRGIGIGELLQELLPEGKERVAWEKMASVLVVARLCEPSSELHIAEDWYRRTALSDLLQLDEAHVNKDRLYRALDALLAHKAAIEAHLSRRSGELFAIENDVLLYDVTSTYFEGQAEANALAERGYSRDHRADCKQVLIALVVTFDGFPLGYEVFAGNTNDSRTLQTIVTTMEDRHGMLGRVWIADRGMASKDNLAWLRQTGRRYIIGAPKSDLKKFAPELATAGGWREIREGVEVKLAHCPETGDSVVLCRSADRRSKEQSMHDKFSRRIEVALERLATRISRSKRRLDREQVNRQIGRILQQNQRAAQRFKLPTSRDSMGRCADTVDPRLTINPAGMGSRLSNTWRGNHCHSVMKICWSYNVAGDQSISSAATACLAGKRVLVVEDTWVVAKALQSLLEEAGLVVSGPSASIADAERLVAEQVPQLAIVDLRLNGEIAHDLINCLHDRGVSVVVVSGLVSKPPAKAAAIVQKPFSEAVLIETLCSVVGRHSENP